MKTLSLLVWLTQLGLSVAFPLAGFTLLAVWLQQKFHLGVWVVILGAAIGVLCAVDGFRTSLKALRRLTEEKTPPTPPPVSFNDHD